MSCGTGCLVAYNGSEWAQQLLGIPHVGTPLDMLQNSVIAVLVLTYLIREKGRP